MNTMLIFTNKSCHNSPVLGETQELSVFITDYQFLQQIAPIHM